MDSTPSRPRPATDVSAADWVVEGVGAFASGVKGLLPSGFESYARILHPAWPSGAAAQEGSTPQPVPWRVVAAAAGAEMHRRVQFESLVGAGRGERREYAPDEGELPTTTLTALCAVLRRYTGSPEHCWFCLWEGWGWIEGSAEIITSTHGSFDAPPAFPPETLDGPRVSLPHRDYLLFEGPLAAATELGWRIGEVMGSAYPEVGFDPEEFQPQSPNLFWPQDRSWCIATEIDLDSTYVGGSGDLCEALLDDPRLEAWPARLDDRIDAGADVIHE